MTSTEFERTLSATGPTSSIVLRPSDGMIPRKVAWLQCVGSRDKTNEYCSSVCCMYATKEAIIAKEHQNDIEPTIFYMDVRAFGKGFDQYYERAKHEHGVRYVKSAISRILEDPETKNLEIVYVDEDGQMRTEVFDLVVLSVGMRPAKNLKNLARVLDIGLNEYGFVKSSPRNPLLTTREGVYVAGASESPKDIPETVTQASGAGVRSRISHLGGAGQGLHRAGAARGTGGACHGRAADRRLYMPLRRQHRGGRQRARGEGIRKKPPQCRHRGREPLYLLPGHAGEDEARDQRVQPEQGDRCLLLAEDARIPLPLDHPRGGTQ